MKSEITLRYSQDSQCLTALSLARKQFCTLGEMSRRIAVPGTTSTQAGDTGGREKVTYQIPIHPKSYAQPRASLYVSRGAKNPMAVGPGSQTYRHTGCGRARSDEVYKESIRDQDIGRQRLESLQQHENAL